MHPCLLLLLLAAACGHAGSARAPGGAGPAGPAGPTPAAPASAAAPTSPPPGAPPAGAPAGEGLRSTAALAALEQVVLDAPPGADLAEVAERQGGACGRTTPSVGSPGRRALALAPFSAAFGQVVDRLPPPPPGAAPSAPLRVEARLVRATTRECREGPGVAGAVTGNGHVEVAWTVWPGPFSYRNEGSLHRDLATPLGREGLLAAALGDAAENLVEQPGFRALAGLAPPAPPAPEAAPAAAAPRHRARRVDPRGGALADHLAAVRLAVARVEAPGAGGTGFVLAAEGWLLTAARAVGPAQEVSVVLHGGRRCAGRVEAVHVQRGLALVKVACDGLTALPLSRQRVAMTGATHLAVAGPGPRAEVAFHRGTLTALRLHEGQEFAWSDAPVPPGASGAPLLDAAGNVLAVAVEGLDGGPGPSGSRAFVPAARLGRFLPIDLE